MMNLHRFIIHFHKNTQLTQVNLTRQCCADCRQFQKDAFEETNQTIYTQQTSLHIPIRPQTHWRVTPNKRK